MIFCIEVTAIAGCVPGETGFPGNERSKQRKNWTRELDYLPVHLIECHTCFISTQCLVSEKQFIYFRTC